MNRQTLIIVLVAAIAALTGVLAGGLLLGPPEPPALVAGTQLPEPRPLPEFTLVDAQGEPLHRSDLEDDWTLVFFGFTHCPDVCPNTLFLLDRIVDQLSETGDTTPQVLFVSVDPQRDSAEQIRDYLAYFNPDFIGATGDEENLQKLAQSMSVAYELRPHGEDYDVIHSSAVLLLDPQARLHTLFTPPLKADEIVSDLQQLLHD